MGSRIESAANNAAAGNDAAFAFKTGFSARALIGLLGNDDFSFKVSPDGSAFFDAIKVDRTNGQVELPQPTILPGLSAAPSPPPTGKAAVYARTVVNCIGIGFQRGIYARWQLIANVGTGAPTLTDMGASFAITTGGVLTLFFAAPPNGSSVWVRVVDEVSGAVFGQEITADLPAATQFRTPQLFMNNGTTAAAVAHDCTGRYVETDS